MSYEEQHRQDWNRATAGYARTVRRYTDAVFDEYFHVRTVERTGRVTSVGEGRVAVDLFSDGAAPPVAVLAWAGQPHFPTSAVGKLVRVWERITSQPSPSGGQTVIDRAWIIDTLLGNQ